MPRFILLAAALLAPSLAAQENPPMTARNVGDTDLVHTSQLFSAAREGMSAKEQAKQILMKLDEIRANGGLLEAPALARLHIVVTSLDAVPEVLTIANVYARRATPITVVVGALPVKGALVGIDAVFSTERREKAVKPVAVESFVPTFGPAAAILPAGPKVFISGQAEKGATPAEAAANTIASLKKTLDWLGCKPEDAVQAKCFLTPMSAAADVAKEFDKAFGPNKVPLVFVEWKSTLPIEIELIAKAPPSAATAPHVEYLTPPGFTPSPVYARVVKVNRGNLIYTSGLVSEKPGDGEAQVLDIFKQLKAMTESNGSDLKHLVKATYYVSDDDASKKLNDLRPRYYDPKRPPAASKAIIPGLAAKDRGIVIDMIAVTK